MATSFPEGLQVLPLCVLLLAPGMGLGEGVSQPQCTLRVVSPSISKPHDFGSACPPPSELWISFHSPRNA